MQNEVLLAVWRYLTFPLWALQPSYPDPDAWVVLAFYEVLWIAVHAVLILATVYWLSTPEEPE